MPDGGNLAMAGFITGFGQSSPVIGGKKRDKKKSKMAKKARKKNKR